MAEKRKAGIYLVTDTGVDMEVILVDHEGTSESLMKGTVIEHLVSFVNLDLSAYKAALDNLWDTHDVFMERAVVPYEDYLDFEKQAIQTIEMVHGLDPVAYTYLQLVIAVLRETPDDGNPQFASEKAFSILKTLRIPHLAQNYMRNIFEIAFADHERGTQQDRFRALEDAHPGTIDRSFTMRFLPATESGSPVSTRREYDVTDISELYLVELSLYFQQNEKRIARCENCWRYFVPDTDAESLYCYGEVDGVPCKEAGPKNKRKFNAEQDEALVIYDRLRRRLKACVDRYEVAAPDKRDKLIPLDYEQYLDWLKMAQEQKKLYKDGKISSETFLRRIDTFNLLETYETKKSGLISSVKTLWRKMISSNLNADAKQAFPDMLSLNPGTGTGWTLITTEEQLLSARGGHTSLHQRYGVDDPIKPNKRADELTEMHMAEKDPDTKDLSGFIRDAMRYSMTGKFEEEDEP